LSGNLQKTKIVLTFESDWHVGTGTGIPGSTDRRIFRDSGGFPAVPAKTLNGIWRDAMETLCAGLGNGWGKWVEFIFGIQPNEIKKVELKKRLENDEKTYSFSNLNLRPARISENLREAIGDDERLKQALTFIKAGIAIDNASGTAKENCLRFEEMGRSGTILEAEFELQTDDETAKALLVLSGGLIERIGGKRRRGAGKCKFEVKDLMTKEDAIEHLEKFQNESNAPIPPSISDDFNKIDLTASDRSTEWQTLEYRLILQTPVSIVTAVLGNVSESLDFIPGTYLLPHITKNLGKNVRSAVANGDFQVSPATIEINKKRSFPIPKVFAKEKIKQKEKEREEIYNRLFETLEGKFQTKPIREGYISSLTSDTLSIEKTPKTLLIHNTVEDKFQRPTTEVGGVYSREAIKAGTVLRGEIRWKKSLNLEEKDFEKLKNYIRLGTSKKDDYGLAEFDVFENKTVGKDERKIEKRLVVYLASDVLLRSDNLRQTNLVEDLKKELEKTFGMGTLKSYDELLKNAKGNLEKNTGDNGAKEFIESRKSLMNSIIQVRRIESWQVSWGFPRPTLTAMSAGSVIVFETKEKIDLQKLEEIEANGIGERRGEGYGQIIFNPPLLMNSVKNSDEKKEREVKKGDISKLKNLKEELEFAKQIELTAWREELKVAVLKIAAEKDLRKKIFGFKVQKGNDEKKSVPPMSQIGGLRSAISRLQSNSAADKKLMTDWLEHLKQTSNRFEKWGDNRNDKFSRLESLVKQDDKIWLILFQSRNQSGKRVWKSIPKFVRQKKEIRAELWAEAVRALFYACQHAHKRDLEKPEQKKEAANG
jgi:CRISPR-associated protein Csx10